MSSEPREEQIDESAVTLCEWRLDPVKMVVEEFGVTPDDWQADGLRTFANPAVEQLAMIACMGPGKSALAAWLTWNFCATRTDSNIAVCSVTGDNLKDGLWKELRKWWKRSPMLQRMFRFQGERIYSGDPESWFISARKFKKGASAEEQEETLRGLHADHVMVIIDEAGGVPAALVNGVQGIRGVRGQEAKIVILGNPIVAAGPLYQASLDPHVHVIRISGDPEDPDRSPRISVPWAKEMIRRFGRRNPWVQSNILGQFPRNVSEGILALEEIEEAIGRTLDNAGEPLQRSPKTLGLDVARRGKNLNTLWFREGDYIVDFQSWQGVPTTETAGRLIGAIRDFVPDYVFIDDLGIGGAVVDICNAQGVSVIGVNVAERSRLPELHGNLRSELAGEIQLRFRAGRISLPEKIRTESTFIQEATELRFKFGMSGARKLEDKDSFIKRVGISPDHYDGFALALADASMTAVVAPGDELELRRGRYGATTGTAPEIADNYEDGWTRRRISCRIGGRR